MWHAVELGTMDQSLSLPLLEQEGKYDHQSRL